MEKPKEECKNQLQKKDCYNYGDFSLEELKEIIEEVFKKPVENNSKLKSGKDWYNEYYNKCK